MTTLATVWARLAAVASPAPAATEPSPPYSAPTVYGEPAIHRTSFVVTSKVCVCVLAGLLGYRVCLLGRHPANRMTLTQIYIFVLYALSIGFVTSAAIVNNGLGLTTDSSCKASVIMCLLFYAGSKVAVYLFLVEHAHILRAPYTSRSKDKLWLLSTVGIVASLGAICIIGLVSPVYYLSDKDGRCRIGLQRYSGIPLLTIDIIINIYLTLVFVYLLSPLIKNSHPSGIGLLCRVTQQISSICCRAKQKATVDLHRSNKALAKKVDKLHWKTLMGCVLVIFPTAGNLTAICVLVGRELAFVCLTACTLDVTWTACVFHWLTIAGADENGGAPVAPQGQHSSVDQAAQPIQAHSEPPRRRPTTRFHCDLDLLSIDAEKDDEADAVGKSGLDLDHVATRSSDGPSSQVETSWTDSDRSTLVAEMSVANKAVEPR